MEKFYNHSASGDFLKKVKMLFTPALLLLLLILTEVANSQTVTGNSVCYGNDLIVGVTPSKSIRATFGLYRTTDGGATYLKVDEAYSPSFNFTFQPQTVVGTYRVFSFEGYPPCPDNPLPTGTLLSPDKYIYALPVASISGATAPCFNSTQTYTTESYMSNYTWVCY
jgi:hypothetical protein